MKIMVKFSRIKTSNTPEIGCEWEDMKWRSIVWKNISKRYGSLLGMAIEAEFYIRFRPVRFTIVVLLAWDATPVVSMSNAQSVIQRILGVGRFAHIIACVASLALRYYSASYDPHELSGLGWRSVVYGFRSQRTSESQDIYMVPSGSVNALNISACQESLAIR